MKTAIEQLIYLFEIDRMQSTYTKEQIIELLTFKLEKEKQQIIDAHGDKLKKSRSTSNYEYWFTGEDYYNETFNS